MSIGEILDRGFRLYRNHFLKFFLAVLATQAVAFIFLQVYMAKFFTPFYHVLQNSRLAEGVAPDLDPASVVHFAGGTFVFGACYALLGLVYLGALIHLTHDTFFGKATGIAQAYTRTLKRLWPLIRVNIVKLNILGVAFLIWLAPLSISIHHRNWFVTAAWIILGALPFLFAYLWLALVSIVLLVENRGIMDSLRRSARLMYAMTEKGFLRNNAFRVSVILLVILAIRQIIHMVSQAPFAAWKVFEIFRDPGMLAQYNRTALDSLFELINMVMQSATAPFGLAALVLFYIDIRIRKEGLDLSLRLQTLREGLQQTQLQKA